MSGNLPKRLLQLSEAADHPVLFGTEAAAYPKAEFARLLSRRILIELEPASEWPVCDACECDLEARPIQQINGKIVAPCPLDRGCDVVLDAEDVRSFCIDPPALVREIAAASFGDEPSQIASGVWHLGLTATKRATFLTLSKSAALQPGLVGILRLFDRSSQMTLIAPPIPAADHTRFAEAGILLVSARDCLICDVGAATFAIDLAKLEPPSALAPRLIICRSAKSVSLDGVSKTLSDQTFTLLVLLAEQAMKSPAVLENRRIEDHLWGSSIHRITSEVREPARALRDALAAGIANPKAVRSLIENRRNPNGYRLALAPEDIQLIP